MQFHSDYVRIPGIHAEFSTAGLERFLTHRSATNKNLAVILSKIKKMGEACGFVLCTSKYQQPSLQYQQIASMKARLKKARRLAGRDAVTNEALATGNFAVTLLLSAFDVRSKRRFEKIHPTHRELIVINAMKHTGCIRYGLFRFTDILKEQLVFSAHLRAQVLRATWRKMHKSNRPYSITFPMRPPANSPARYALPGARGPTYITAGKLISWYLDITGLKDAPGHSLLFPCLALIPNRRAYYANWLKSVYKALLPPECNLYLRIRPHSNRAGWATDRARDNTNPHTILMEGRWSDIRAMTKYIRTSLRDLLTSSLHRPIPDDMKYNPVRSA